MTILYFLFPIKILVHQPFNYLGGVLIIVGLAIAKIVSNQFTKRNTEIHTFKVPGQLVTNGLFKYSRNPIYLGFSVLLSGLAVLFGSLSAFVIVFLFIIATDRWYIKFEEKKMQEQFGEAYRNYKMKVRRWI
jgi:protein-S-isoprenylcysteine O-methyltransferase Ste14